MILLNVSGYLKNYIRIAYLNFKSNLSGNIFAFSIMSFSFFIMLFFLLCYVNIYSYMLSFSKNGVIIALLKNNSDPVRVLASVRNINGIGGVEYYDGAGASDFLKNHNINIAKNIRTPESETAAAPTATAAASKTASPLRLIKISLSANRPDKLLFNDIYFRLKSVKGVRLVYYNKKLERMITQFMFFTKSVGLLLFVFLFALSIFISYSAIKLVILRKRHEIEILKLIGATNAYIMIPMLFEGMAGTVLSFGAATALLFGIFKIFVLYRFDGFLKYFNIKIIFLSPTELTAIFIIAAVSGFSGTFMSSRKFF